MGTLEIRNSAEIYLGCEYTAKLFTCSEMVQGIRSPEAFFPLERLFMIVWREISPSMHTCQKRWKTINGEKLLQSLHYSRIKIYSELLSPLCSIDISCDPCSATGWANMYVSKKGSAPKKPCLKKKARQVHDTVGVALWCNKSLKRLKHRKCSMHFL